MAQFVSSFTNILGTFSEHLYLDDAIDRANRIYVPVILLVTASLLAISQFFGDPIEVSYTACCTPPLIHRKKCTFHLHKFDFKHSCESRKIVLTVLDFFSFHRLF
jgi:hypothetical protein